MRFRDASSTASWLRKRGKAKGPALSRQSRSELALCFSMIDEDDNGAIDADELRVAFAALGVDATRAQCVAEIARVDRDRSGTIQLPEFVTLVTSLDASSGRDGAISRTPRRVEAVRRLTAGADADTDARVVLAEAGVGPDGQGMERALADARARVDATGTGEHSRRGAATASDERSSTTRARNAPPAHRVDRAGVQTADEHRARRGRALARARAGARGRARGVRLATRRGGGASRGESGAASRRVRSFSGSVFSRGRVHVHVPRIGESESSRDAPPRVLGGRGREGGRRRGRGRGRGRFLVLAVSARGGSVAGDGYGNARKTRRISEERRSARSASSAFRRGAPRGVGFLSRVRGLARSADRARGGDARGDRAGSSKMMTRTRETRTAVGKPSRAFAALERRRRQRNRKTKTSSFSGVSLGVRRRVRGEGRGRRGVRERRAGGEAERRRASRRDSRARPGRESEARRAGRGVCRDVRLLLYHLI